MLVAQGLIQERVFKLQLIGECMHFSSHHLEFISQKADSLYSIVSAGVEDILYCSSVEEDMLYCLVLVCC